MMACHVIGDSIALGVAYHMTGCHAQATKGISAERFDAVFAGVDGGLTVISLGSNPGYDDEEHLRRVRARVGGTVVWLLPPARSRVIVTRLAAERGDAVVDVRRGGAGPGHIHPNGAGYGLLASLVGERAAP